MPGSCRWDAPGSCVCVAPGASSRLHSPCLFTHRTYLCSRFLVTLLCSHVHSPTSLLQPHGCPVGEV